MGTIFKISFDHAPTMKPNFNKVNLMVHHTPNVYIIHNYNVDDYSDDTDRWWYSINVFQK